LLIAVESELRADQKLTALPVTGRAVTTLEQVFMGTQTSPDEAAERVARSFQEIEQELPALANITRAFKDLFVERARLRAECWQTEDFVKPTVSSVRFREGVPIAALEIFDVSAEDLKRAATRLIPAMERGFPKLSLAANAIREALLDGRLDPAMGVKDLLENREEATSEIARSLQIDPGVLRFVLGQLVKPFAESRAASLAHLIDEAAWSKGYCPICGSWPCFSFLWGEQGERRLKCSSCAHEWGFMRTVCPFCENADPDGLEYFYSEDRQSERAEVCTRCKRYIVNLDLRQRHGDPLMEVAPLGLIYLDILAQQRGFHPGAVTEWNVLDLP
jgi:FdhE protein